MLLLESVRRFALRVLSVLQDLLYLSLRELDAGLPFDFEEEVGTLIPALQDEVVSSEVWRALMKFPSEPLFENLRLTSRAWIEFVVTTVEWNAWLFTSKDGTHGFEQLLGL